MIHCIDKEAIKACKAANEVWPDESAKALQKAHMGLYIRAISIKRAETKIMLANLAYNMQRLIFHERGVVTR